MINVYMRVTNEEAEIKTLCEFTNIAHLKTFFYPTA